MRIAVTGSIATDHLMTFPGRFADSLVAEQLDKISLSFLVDDLEVRRGGVAANIAFGMAVPRASARCSSARSARTSPTTASWLERHGVDCRSVHVSELRHTARFVCTTDADQAQIASFYAGAMSEAREIELGPIADRVGGLDLVVIGANDPEAMLRHTEECRSRGHPVRRRPVAAARLRWTATSIRQLIDGAAYLFTNEYEAALTEQKTGWTADEILDRVGDPGHHPGQGRRRSWHARARRRSQVPVAREVAQGRPDRRRRRLPRRLPRRPRLGPGHRALRPGRRRCSRPTSSRPSARRSTSSAQARFLERFADAYGDEAAAEVEPHLACRAPLSRPRRPPCPSSRPVARGGFDAATGRPPARTSSASAPTSSRARCSRPTARAVPDGARRRRRGAARLVVAGPARRAAARRAARSAGRCAGRCARFEVRVDTAFDEVVARAAPTPPRTGGWITPDDRRAPTPAARAGLGAQRRGAGSDGELVGGLYGVAIGGLFAGESMFHRATRRLEGGAGRAGRICLRRRRPARAARRAVGHRRTCASLGVVEVPRAEYLRPARRGARAAPAGACPALGSGAGRGAARSGAERARGSLVVAVRRRLVGRRRSSWPRIRHQAGTSCARRRVVGERAVDDRARRQRRGRPGPAG